jgi:Flp pilus assembly protein TadD
MVGTQIRPGFVGTMFLALAAAVSAGGASAQSPPAGAPAAQASQDSSLFEIAAVKARLAAARLEGSAARGRRADPLQAQYLAGVEQLGKHQFDSAMVPLQAAALVSQTNARYHGDYGYALVGVGRWDEAANEYATAVRLQSGNPWYYVGLAAVRAHQEHWQQAAANFALAVSTDSSIIDPRLVAAASECLERAGFTSDLLEWSRMATVRFPDEPMPFLRLAMLLQRIDTVAGLAAIRRFRTLAPSNRLGQAIYAHYLNGQGQYDSSVAMVRSAVTDTSLRNYAWPVFLTVGAHLLQAKDLEKASQVLEEGRRLAPADRHARFSLYLGYSNVQRLAPLYTDAAQKKDCGKAQLVDSLVTTVDRDMHESMALGDSAQMNQIIATVLPQFRTRVKEVLDQCR